MNKPAVSLALAGTLSLAALAGCGSNSSTSSPSTSATSTTSTASPSSTDTASQSPSDTTSAASPTSTATSASDTPSAKSTTSATGSATSAAPSASVSIQGIPYTAEGWRITVPFGWGGATQKNGGDTYHLWTADKSSTKNLMVMTGQLSKGESFDEDLKGVAKDTGLGGGTDINKPISVPGADSAQELAGMAVNGTKEAYVDLVVAHKGRAVVMVAVGAPSKAALNSAGLHQTVLSLARA